MKCYFYSFVRNKMNKSNTNYKLAMASRTRRRIDDMFQIVPYGLLLFTGCSVRCLFSTDCVPTIKNILTMISSLIIISTRMFSHSVSTAIWHYVWALDEKVSS